MCDRHLGGRSLPRCGLLFFLITRTGGPQHCVGPDVRWSLSQLQDVWLPSGGPALGPAVGPFQGHSKAVFVPTGSDVSVLEYTCQIPFHEFL